MKRVNFLQQLIITLAMIGGFSQFKVTVHNELQHVNMELPIMQHFLPKVIRLIFMQLQKTKSPIISVLSINGNIRL